MPTKSYKKTPLGAEKANIPQAKIVNTTTNTTIVSGNIEDDHYFRLLEKQGIYLNEPQLEAVRHYQGPLLTLAGAGSGKTSVLISRTGYLISVKEVQPKNILLVTFTKKAALEMKHRISQLPGLTNGMANQIQASTFHSFFLTILRHKGYQQEIVSSERFKQFIVKQILKEMNVKADYQPETLLAEFSSFKVNMLVPDEVPSKTPAEKEVKLIFQKYEQWKRSNNRMDYDDILLESYHLLEEDTSFLSLLQQRFTYVMVDEFQDTNRVQYELIKMLVAPHQNLVVVGDDDQTIYTFNGARHEFILNFVNEFKQAKTVTLDINYRSTASIVGLGNEVIRFNNERNKKTLHATKQSEIVPSYSRPPNTDEEAAIIIKHIQHEIKQKNRVYKDIAILHRTTSNSRAMFEQLALHDIPFTSYAGSDQIFYEQWMVKPVIDHLRLAMQPRDFDAMEGMVQTLFLNKERAMEFIQQKEAQSRKKYPLIHLTRFPAIKDFHRESIKERNRFIKRLKEMKPYHAIQAIRIQFYDEFLETNGQNLTLHKETLNESLDELVSSAKRFEQIPAFLAFIDEMMTKSREMVDNRKNPQADAVNLMTIHRSKGLEFPVVYLIGASEGILPHSSAVEADPAKKEKKEKDTPAIEEERRLAYVAITRAQEELYISSPSYYRGKKAEISRFIQAPFTS